MSKCDLVKQFLLMHLRQDIEAHEKGLYAEIGKAQDNLPRLKECEAEDDEEAHRLSIAIDF